jgi:prephenate dehydratase
VTKLGVKLARLRLVNESDAKVAEALQELKTTSAFYKNLGSYPHSA